MGIFHDHRARDGVRFFHPALEFPFGDVLDVLINGEDDAVAGFGLLLHTGKPALARVDGNHQLAGLALQLLVELPLQAAQPLIVGANVPQNLRRQFTFRIKSLRFFLVVDALQIQRPDALNHFGIRLPCHPTEGLVGATIGEHGAGIVFRDARNQADRIGKVGSFRGHHEGRVHLDGHCQLTSSAIVDNAALRRKIKAALLLVLRAAFEIAIAKDLEIDQPQTDRQQPQAKQSRQGVEPESCAVRRGARRHFPSSETFGGPEETLPGRRRVCPPPRPQSEPGQAPPLQEKNYRAETTATGVTLAITGATPSESASMRTTCPGCGDCMPSLRAITSIRSGSRSDASSRRRARFISVRPSRCDRSVSILYPYSIARKCCSAYPMTSRNRQHSANENCFISRARRGSSSFTRRELSMVLRK